MYTGAHSAKTVLIIFRKKALDIFHKMERQYIRRDPPQVYSPQAQESRK